MEDLHRKMKKNCWRGKQRRLDFGYSNLHLEMFVKKEEGKKSSSEELFKRIVPREVST
jgi:hypothetical protein